MLADTPRTASGGSGSLTCIDSPWDLSMCVSQANCGTHPGKHLCAQKCSIAENQASFSSIAQRIKTCSHSLWFHLPIPAGHSWVS